MSSINSIVNSIFISPSKQVKLGIKEKSPNLGGSHDVLPKKEAGKEVKLESKKDSSYFLTHKYKSVMPREIA